MKSNLYSQSIEVFVPLLRTLAGLLEKGADHARGRDMDPAALAGARLAPDMFPLTTQVQLACHHARDATARLTGKTPPKIDNRDLTLDELTSLVESTVSGLEKADAAMFEGADDVVIDMPLPGSLVFHSDGMHFLRDWSIPNFYFHVVTAYDILRHCGVEIGKRDFMGHIGPYLKQRG